MNLLKPRGLAKCKARNSAPQWDCTLGDLCKLDEPIPYEMTAAGKKATDK